MNKQLIVFYLKRHAIGIVGLVLAIGFGAAGFIMMGKAKAAVTKVETDYTAAVDRRATLEKGQALGSSQGVKVDSKNVAAANDEAEIYRGFIKDAAEVVRRDSIEPMLSEEFMVHMASVIEELNLRAREASVQVLSDPTNTSIRIPYNFTFMNLRSVPQLSKDKIPELQVQLKDIRTISEVLFQSRVRSIKSLQRNRVTYEDYSVAESKDFLDTRMKYTNTISVVRPYKVRFQCLSGGIAKTLNGFASEENFIVIRRMEVSKPGGEVEIPTATATQVLTPQQMAWLVRQGFATTKATNVTSESLLEVELDLDIIRKKPSDEDTSEEVEPVPIVAPQPGQPLNTTNAPAVTTNAPAVNTNAPAVNTNAPAVNTNAPAVNTNAIPITTSTKAP